ncbi:WD40 repeat domain-containing protein [Streptomyces sp. TRM70350]|uniref:WD40 repeat domain-containing protein n=1 Tax=Streptomyces sp. TRM70350 TaxID=2856165 RepID=UPI001C49440A|nr:YncE family protein [Streptomyces sp. TRM70350]MBV7699427.1 hypothetical protein [Streptomyces sp. TRM70350]
MTRSRIYRTAICGVVLGAASLGLVGVTPAMAAEWDNKNPAATEITDDHRADTPDTAWKMRGVKGGKGAEDGASRHAHAADDSSRTAKDVVISVGDAPSSVAVAPDGSHAYVLLPGSVSVIDAAADKVAHRINLPTPREERGPRSMAMSPDGSRLYVVGESGTHVIDTATNTLLPDVWGPAKARSVAVSPDGQYIALADGDGAAWLVDVAQHKKHEIRLPEGGPALRGGPAFASGDRLYLATDHGAVAIEVKQPDRVAGEFVTRDGGAEDVALSPDGRLYTVGTKGGITVFDVSTKRIVAHMPEADARTVAFSPDGKRVYSAGSPHTESGLAKLGVGVFDATKDQIVPSAPEKADLSKAIAVSPDGSRAYVTDPGAGTVTIVDLTRDAATGTEPGVESGAGVGSEQPAPAQSEPHTAPSPTAEPKAEDAQPTAETQADDKRPTAEPRAAEPAPSPSADTAEAEADQTTAAH